MPSRGRTQERLRRAHRRQLPTYGTLPTQGTSAKFSSLVAVVSFGTSSTCSGTSGAYRIDQPDDLAFLATFGISP
jgi:hypothetical protein